MSVFCLYEVLVIASVIIRPPVLCVGPTILKYGAECILFRPMNIILHLRTQMNVKTGL